MTEKNRFDHDRSPYERPNFPYRCGREAAFGKPCPRGPSEGGSCQGVADCQPFQTRKVVADAETGEEREIVRWECRRPAWAGGPCAEGPRPDGACACVHPPCAPRATIRKKRGRWALVAVAAVVSMALAFTGLAGIANVDGLPSSLDPGELSGKHAQFTAQDGCISCHVGHSETLTGWASAIFETQPIAAACVSCHAFGDGDDSADEPGALVFAAHNRAFPNAPDAPEAECTSCHTEHRGENASIISMTDGQCSSCHSEITTDFGEADQHFRPNFPHFLPRTIKFPHDQHLTKHFEDARYADRAPQNGCQTCHYNQVDGRLLPGGFDVGCAGCHEDAIKEQGFAVFGLPEMSDPTLTADASETCGFTADQTAAARALLDGVGESGSIVEALANAVEGVDPVALATAAQAIVDQSETLNESREEFNTAIDAEEAISLEYLTAPMGYMLGVATDDLDEYSEPAAEMLVRATEEGRTPFAEALEERGGDPSVLLAGLTSELVTRVTCAWTANAEYEPVEYAAPGQGWAAEEYQVSYLPTGHADSVIKNWIGFALASRTSDAEGAEGFQQAILDPSDGPGRCFKCHVAPAESTDAAAEVTWAIPRTDVSPHTTFNHLPHLNVLESGAGCATCHKILGDGETLADNQKRPGPHANDFKPIERTTCQECHHQGGVQQDCSLCHKYHSEPSIRKRTM